MQFLHETIKKTDFLTTVSGILNKKIRQNNKTGNSKLWTESVNHTGITQQKRSVPEDVYGIVQAEHRTSA